jgi:hypothetical protein
MVVDDKRGFSSRSKALSLIHSTPPPTPPSVPATLERVADWSECGLAGEARGVEAERTGTLYTYQTRGRLYRSAE